MIHPVSISLIAARSRNGVIGVDGDLPWRLPDDLAFFKATTKGHPVLMGRKTWDSLPRKPLPGRDNIVLTHNRSLSAPGARIYAALEPALEAAKAIAAVQGLGEIFVIGGAALYEAALPQADRLYLTEVDVTLDGDARFPEVDETLFDEVARQTVEADARNQYAFTIRTLYRRR